jgi:hypothetical protein
MAIAPMPNKEVDASAPLVTSANPAATNKKSKLPPKYEGIAVVLDSSSRGADDTSLRKAFADLRKLSDPRAADVLVRFLEKPGSPIAPRWKTQAGLALGELGDVRAVATLAWRLKQDPLKLYDRDKDPDLRMDDNERVVSARYIADLLRLYPERKDEIAKAAEDGLLAWVTDKPQPHANGLRALALMNSAKARPKIRGWSDPKEALPSPGQQTFSPAWPTAQVAQRYLGLTWRDSPETDASKRDALALFRRQLTRRPEKVDTSMDALLQGGIAVLGMTVRALAVGAVQGMVEAKDTHAFDTLTKFIDDEKANEQARAEACTALGFVASPTELVTIATKKINGGAGASQLPPKQDFVRRCYVDGLARRGDSGVARALLPLLLAKTTDAQLRIPLATAIGAARLGPPSTPAMQSLNGVLGDPDLRGPAALAMLLGGDLPPAAAKDLCARVEISKEVQVVQTFDSIFGTVYEHELDDGVLARRLRNASECGGDVKKLAEHSLQQGVSFDAGPRTVTRVVLRARLIAMAKESKDPDKRAEAQLILQSLNEEATLDALGLD